RRSPRSDLFARRRRASRLLRRRRLTANADGRLAKQAGDNLAALVILDEHVLAALRVGTAHGENHIPDPTESAGCAPTPPRGRFLLPTDRCCGGFPSAPSCRWSCPVP